jgi:hypothetical protein
VRRSARAIRFLKEPPPAPPLIGERFFSIVPSIFFVVSETEH